MFRNGCLESIEALMAEGEIYDIDYQQPCEDCISRQTLIDKATSWGTHFADSERAVSLTDIMSLPSVTPHPKRGKWTRSWCEWQQYLECSKCGYETGLRCDTNYCPNCGAKMEVNMEECDKE